MVATTDFFDRVWTDKYVSENVLKQSISELRSGIGDGERLLIKTVPKIGYVLRAPVELLENTPSAVTNASSATADQNNQAVAPLKVTNTLSQDADTQELPAHQVRTVVKESAKRHLLSNHHYKAYIRQVTILLFCLLGLGFGWHKYTNLLSQNELLTQQYISETAHSNLISEITSQYFRQDSSGIKTLLPLLERALKRLEGEEQHDVRKLGKLSALTTLYQQTGALTQARIVAKRASVLTESLFGASSEAYLKSQFSLMDINIALRDRQNAYDIAQHILALLEEYPHNNHTKASAIYQVSRGYLFCVEPFCERAEAMHTGEKYARQALKLHREGSEIDQIAIADSLVLVNWFLFEGNEKKQLMKEALSLYEGKLGDNHVKTVAALEEYGRIIAFYDNDWTETEGYLLRALSARKRLHPPGDLKIARIQHYLGEHYFMSGDFKQAKEYLQQSMINMTAALGEGNDKYVEQLVLLSRSYLYSDEAQKAKNTLLKADSLFKQYKFTPSVVIARALQTTQLRVDLYLNKIIEHSKLISLQQSLIDTFKSPNSVLIHEYQSQILRFHPTQVSDTYISNLQKLVDDYVPTSRYLYAIDITWLHNRAMKDCRDTKPQLCDKIEEIFQQKLTDIALSPSIINS